MDASTYADADVVSLIGERFVAIRVDADRRPDLNERYNLGGWPTTSFLTGDGDVLTGGTYFDRGRMLSTLHQVADAYRERATALAARAAAIQRSALLPVDRSPEYGRPVEYFRARLLDQFDPVHGGFGSAPKLPHAHALLFALSLTDDQRLRAAADDSIRALEALWDPVDGGFYRYADGSDWSHPATEKTLEDHAVLLHVMIEAVLTGHGDAPRARAAEIVRWVRQAMSDDTGGFFNARTTRIVDRTKYVDRNAMMISALVRAAALFDDVWLRDLALNAIESVIVPVYKPGEGVGHVATADREEQSVRGLLSDQIHAAAALVWAHAATGRLPYSMLAAELVQFALRTMWDEANGCFRDRVAEDDPVAPFELNCHAAQVLDRLGVLTGEVLYQHRAQDVLSAFAAEFRRHDLFGASYALAVREVLERRPPAGLELSPVDWGINM
jgi:uncharacterized protein YyaL (SSP411 family)